MCLTLLARLRTYTVMQRAWWPGPIVTESLGRN